MPTNSLRTWFEFLENEDDMQDAESVLTALAEGMESTVPWESVKAEHGL